MPLLAVPWLAGILVIAWGLGAAVMTPRGCRPRTVCDEWPITMALGLGVIAYAVFALGMFGFFTTSQLQALVGSLAIIAVPKIYQLRREIRAWWLEMPRSKTGPPLLFTMLVTAFAALTLLGALAPKGANDWDALSYHLAVPQLYLDAHRILPLPWMSHSNFPFTTEMLYTLGLGVQGQALASAFHWAFGWLLIAGLLSVTARLATPRAAVFAALALLSAPLLWWEMTTANNDLSLAAFVFFAAWAAWRWKGGERGWLAVAALLAGFAAGTKLMGLLMIALVALSALWWLRAKLLTGLRVAAAAAVLALVIASPWYIKTYAWTGNPVYPFFYSVFGGRNWDASLAASYAESQAQFGLLEGDKPGDQRRIERLALLPWNLTMAPHRFFDHPERPLGYVGLGPLFLALLPALLLWRRQPSGARYLLLLALFTFAAWAVTVQHLRYLLHALPLAAVGVGIAADGLARGGRLARGAVNGVFGAAAGLSFLLLFLLSLQHITAAVGLQSQEDYLRANLDEYRAVEWINQNLLADATVITLGEPRGFYLRRNYLWADPGHSALIDYAHITDEADLVRAWLVTLGATHALIAPQVLDAAARGDHGFPEVLRRAIEGHWLVPLSRQNGWTVWMLRDAGSGQARAY